MGGARVFGRNSQSCLPLPLEENKFRLNSLFPEFHLDEFNYCEFGRLAVEKEYRSTSLLKNILFALSKKAIERKYRYLFSISPPQQARCYRLIFKSLQFSNPYIIHDNIKLPQKSEDECGLLDMQLASLMFPQSNVSANTGSFEHLKTDAA